MSAAPEKLMPDFTGRKYHFHYITALGMLAGMGIDINKILIRAVGKFENYKGEVRTQSPEPGTVISAESKIVLEIGANSPVDYMPYQFFYGLGGLRNTGDAWEQNARSLMAPFDAAVIRHSAGMHINRLKFECGIFDSDHFLKIMNLFEYNPKKSSNAETIQFWASILPSLHEWSGNSEILCSILNHLYGYKFSIRENVISKTTIPDNLWYHLGSKTGRLGKESILGRSFSEYDSTYELVIEKVPASNIAELLPGKTNRSEIEKIIEYCMPGEIDYRIVIKMDENSKGEEKTYLGYSSYL